MISAQDLTNKIASLYKENSLYQEWNFVISDIIKSIIEEDRKMLRKECANKAIKWCEENMNEHNDITNPPRFDEYDGAELSFFIENDK